MIVPVERGVLLTGSAIDAVRYAVDVAQRARGRNGLPPSVMLAALREALAAPGQTDTAGGPAGHPEGVGLEETVSTQEAGNLLGCSPRTARRLAPQLGGRCVGGVWLLDRLAVAEHVEGRET